MFTQLAAMLRTGDTLVITVSRETPETLRVNITPKLFTMDGEKGEDRKALNQPITITGTPGELDSPEFHATLDRFAASTTGLRQTIDDVEAAHKAAGAKKKVETKKEEEKKDEPAAASNPIKDRLAPKPKAQEPQSATLI